jgi:hypothetical protein
MSLVRCPFCAEEIQQEAIKCKHCGEFISKQPASAQPQQLPVAEPAQEVSASARHTTDKILLWFLLVPLILGLLYILMR